MTEVPGNLGQPNDAPMPGAAVRDAKDQLAVAIIEAAQNWHDGEGTYGIDSTARKLLGDASGEVQLAAGALRASADEADRWMNNLDLHPDGRRARSQAALEEGKAAAERHLQNAKSVADLGIGMLIKDSAPPLGETSFDRDRNTIQAKHDIRMLVDSEHGDLTEKLRHLVELDSPISTVLTNDPQFLDLLLMSKGLDVPTRAQFANAVTEFAVHARAQRGNKSAKLVFAARKGLLGTIGGTKSLAQR